MVKAGLYRKQTYVRNNCQARFSGLGKDEFLNSNDSTAETLSCILQHYIKVSDRGIKDLFEQLFNLKAPPGSIPGFRDQLSRRGSNQWLWSFSNERVSVFRIDNSRGREVVAEVLTDKYDGVIFFRHTTNQGARETKVPCAYQEEP